MDLNIVYFRGQSYFATIILQIRGRELHSVKYVGRWGIQLFNLRQKSVSLRIFYARLREPVLINFVIKNGNS